ncbi:MAG: DUF922 domain-containing protein [Anaerolineales bacterium]|nr:DUF922 domain-containing protein [Anaerolineales bacterium]
MSNCTHLKTRARYPNGGYSGHLITGSQRDRTALTTLKITSVITIMCSTIQFSCVPSLDEIEQIPKDEHANQIEGVVAIGTEATEPSTATAAKQETEVMTPVVTHTTIAKQATQYSDHTGIPETVLPTTSDHTSAMISEIAATDVPTPVVTRTPIADQAAEAVSRYWKLVNNRNYDSAWRLLSEGFRKRKHNGDYYHYKDTYVEINLCSVETIKIETIAQHDRSAIVSAHMSYITGSVCDDRRDFVFDFTLTRESHVTAWKIDVVSPVANRDIVLDGMAKCDDAMAAVVPSSLNVRTGPGAGRSGEPLYPIQSYLQKNECVTATATNAGRSWVRISNTPRGGAEGGWVAASFLEFGNTHPERTSLSVVAEPTPPPTAPPLSTNMLQPIGIEYLGSAEYVCYDIKGDSGPELALQMDSLGPYDSDGNKTWAVASLQFVISGGTCYSDGTVDLSDVTVSLNSTITMPCWYPSAGTMLTEISKFDNLMKLIALHELKHVDIAWQWARVLEEQLKNSNTCDQEILNTIYNQVWDDEEAAQDAYHASPDGQIISYP